MVEKDDPDWRERIDSVVLYDKLEDLRVQLKELDRVVRGGRDSLLSEYRRHDQDLSRINAILFQDPTGQKGLLHDVDVLMGRRHEKDSTRGLKWQFWGAIVVAIITSAAMILTNFVKIRDTLLKIDPLEARISQAKHPKSKKKVYVIHHLPAEEPSVVPNP